MTQILTPGDAGRRLAERLRDHVGHSDVVVLAVAPAGVPIAEEVSRLLRAPLDICLIRRLMIPEVDRVPAGTVISGGMWTINSQIVNEHDLSLSELDELAHSERRELEELEKFYRAGRPPLVLSERVAVLVDDGQTDALSLQAILIGLHSQNPKRLLLAVPTMTRSRHSVVKGAVDKVITILPWESIEEDRYWYTENSSSRTHQEIRHALDESARRISSD